jgi:UDP-GlcNAc:undecaprenyl-phosphate GlcNAc-1-phosphate transferase
MHYGLLLPAIALTVASFLLSLALTAATKNWALRCGFVAHPVQDRFHRTAMPLGGGVAIFFTISVFILAVVLTAELITLAGASQRLPEALRVHLPGLLDKTVSVLVVLAGLGMLHLLGLWDDYKHLGPYFKLIVQFAVAAALAALADIRVELFIENKLITTLFSMVWIVLIINAFNFLDNMDGLCAGIAIISSAILLSAAVQSGQVFVGGLALVFIGAMAGFLVYNFPPAKIFMGDAGSLVAGCMVAVLTLRTTYYQQARSGGWYAVLMPLVVMAVPLYDFISVTLLRLAQGKSPFVGDTQHFSHRLKKRGLTNRQTVLTLYLATFCTGLGALSLQQVDLPGAILIFIQTVMILAIIAVLETTVKGVSDDS